MQSAKVLRSNTARRLPLSFKRGFDLVGASLLLIAFAPLMAVIALVVRLDGGAALYGHERVGFGGRLFRCLKFRSMYPDAAARLQSILESDPQARAEWERDYKLKNDPRVTRIGRFLRKTSLDELPQLINVLRGEMSLVGPRPISLAEVPRYGWRIRHFCSVPSGITGFWQVSGRNDVSYRRRVALDSWYARNWSFGLDLYILYRTIFVVLGRKGY